MTNLIMTVKNLSLQNKVALAITGAIQGTSRKKIYQELGLESLRARRWYILEQ